MKTSIILIFVFFLNSVINAQHENNWKAMNDRYALVIGISSYENSANNLRYAAKDAEDFRNSLLEYGKFSKENVKLLVDKNASRENIRKNIEGWLKTIAKKNDLIIIFFSGHGTQIPDTDGDEDDGLDECLLPYDFSADDYSSFVVDDIFAYWIRNLQSNKILIIFDNCFSGGAAKQKGILLPGMKGGKVEDDFSKDISREVPRDGTALLAASKPHQNSWESEEFENGIFTHFLIASISSSTDNNFNNIIDAQELFYHTRSQTLEYSQNKFMREQEPIFVNRIKDELSLFYLPSRESKPDSSEIIEKLLYRARNENNPDKIIEILKKALEIEPTNVRALSALANQYQFQYKYEEALYYSKYLNSLDIQYFSFSPPLSAVIGNIYKNMGDFESALTWYSEALDERPNDYELYNSIATLNLLNKDTLSAIQNLNKSIQIQPLQLKSYRDLFYIHFFQNSFNTAFKIINDCYEINPNDYETIYWYGSFQKYFDNNTLRGDSLLTYFENNSGIEINKSEIWKDKSRLVYDVNGDYLKGEDIQQFVLQKAIARYPYYDSFYKQYIQFLFDNSITDEITSYAENYLLYSKLNPDSSFIKKYIK